jgi:Ca-activated chloride channel family protein
MTFQAPLLLGLLAVVPLVAVIYALSQRRAKKFAVRYTNVDLLIAVAGRSWTRHIPAFLALMALAALLIALARPQRTVAAERREATVMLVFDTSGSMLATDVAPNRLTAARAAAQKFIDSVPKKVRVGVMAFNQTPSVLQSPTTDRVALTDALRRLRSSGGTATGEAIQTATRVLRQAQSVNGKKPPSAIVLLSDGASTRGVDPVQAAQAAGKLKIPVYTVALGTANGTITVPRPGGQGGTEVRRVPPDEASLQRIAQASGGKASAAGDAQALSTVYERLGSQLGRKKVPREITAGFAGAGLALLALGSALSLRWFGRLI